MAGVSSGIPTHSMTPKSTETAEAAAMVLPSSEIPADELNFYDAGSLNFPARKSLLPFQLILVVMISFFILGVIGHVFYS